MHKLNSPPLFSFPRLSSHLFDDSHLVRVFKKLVSFCQTRLSNPGIHISETAIPSQHLQICFFSLKNTQKQTKTQSDDEVSWLGHISDSQVPQPTQTLIWLTKIISLSKVGLFAFGQDLFTQPSFHRLSKRSVVQFIYNTKV